MKVVYPLRWEKAEPLGVRQHSPYHIVFSKVKAIFCARREEAIRLVDADREEVVYHDGDVGFAALHNKRFPFLQRKRRVEAGPKPLAGGLFVAARPVDLTGEI